MVLSLAARLLHHFDERRCPRGEVVVEGAGGRSQDALNVGVGFGRVDGCEVDRGLAARL
jgi:hypothetical protein